MLINVLRDEKPTHVAVAFDRGEPTFRHEQYVEYKANRRETPEDFRSQLSLIFEVLDALGIRRLSAPGYEADDLIATLATQADGAGHGRAHRHRRPRRAPAGHRPGDGADDQARHHRDDPLHPGGRWPRSTGSPRRSTPTSPRSAATRATTCPASPGWGRRPRPSGSRSSARWRPWSTGWTRSRARPATRCASTSATCCATASSPSCSPTCPPRPSAPCPATCCRWPGTGRRSTSSSTRSSSGCSASASTRPSRTASSARSARTPTARSAPSPRAGPEKAAFEVVTELLGPDQVGAWLADHSSAERAGRGSQRAPGGAAPGT